MLDNILNFTTVLMRCSFVDDNGNVRTVQGEVSMQKNTFSYAPGDVVKGDFQLQGNGQLIVFDGYIPCPTTIDSITVDGQTGVTGDIDVTYTFTGDLYQVKYRLDESGDYFYALALQTIHLLNPGLGAHVIEIIPICTNGYEGTGLMQDFQVTEGNLCNSTITSITINGGNTAATNTYTGSATQMQYRIDGGIWTVQPITSPVSLAGLAVGDHTLEEVPLCSFGTGFIQGTGLVKNFNIPTQPAQSILHYQLITDTLASNIHLDIYINGVLNISVYNPGTGSINFPVGAALFINFVSLYGNVSQSNRLQIFDDTLGTVIQDRTVNLPTAIGSNNIIGNGDTFRKVATRTSLT